MPPEPQSAPLRSTFVTAVAWIFIALAGFATFISLLQNIMVYAFFPVEQMRAAMEQARARQEVPEATLFMFEHFREFVTGMFIVFAGTLVISVGLLKRCRWGRTLFIYLLGFGILWNLGATIWNWFFFPSLPPQSPQAPENFAAGFKIMIIVIQVFSALTALATSLLFVWIIKRLSAPAIKREFDVPPKAFSRNDVVEGRAGLS